jgi:hypothetical protein
MRGTDFGAEDAVREHVLRAIKSANMRHAKVLFKKMLDEIIFQTFPCQSSGLKTAISAN